jgi:hypothetical protein
MISLPISARKTTASGSALPCRRPVSSADSDQMASPTCTWTNLSLSPDRVTIQSIMP